MNDIKTYTASDAKNNFGEVLDAARRAPVEIKRHGRPAAFVIAPEDMDAFEDWYLGMRAMEVMKKGKMLGVKKTKVFFDSIRNA